MDLVFAAEFSSIYYSLTYSKEDDNTVQIQNYEHLQYRMGMNEKGGVRVNLCRTYRRRDFCNSGNKEPQDTLRTENTSLDWEYYNERNPTCFQRSCPTPYVPIPSPRKRSSPTSIVRSKTMSVTRRTMMLSLLLSELTTMHCTVTTSQLEWSWKLVRLEGPKYWELLIHPRDA